MTGRVAETTLKQPPRTAAHLKTCLQEEWGKNNSWNSSSLGFLSVRTSLSVGRRKHYKVGKDLSSRLLECVGLYASMDLYQQTKEVTRGGVESLSLFWFRMFSECLSGRRFRHVPSGGDLGADSALTGETVSLGWLGNALVSLWKSRRRFAGDGGVWAISAQTFPLRPDAGWAIENGWMDLILVDVRIIVISPFYLI